jgi:hypothetical protein
MNIYDPAHPISYIHMAGPADACSPLVDDGPACTELPPSYANQSRGPGCNTVRLTFEETRREPLHRTA